MLTGIYYLSSMKNNYYLVFFSHTHQFHTNHWIANNWSINLLCLFLVKMSCGMTYVNITNNCVNMCPGAIVKRLLLLFIPAVLNSPPHFPNICLWFAVWFSSLPRHELEICILKLTHVTMRRSQLLKWDSCRKSNKKPTTTEQIRAMK